MKMISACAPDSDSVRLARFRARRIGSYALAVGAVRMSFFGLNWCSWGTCCLALSMIWRGGEEERRGGYSSTESSRNVVRRDGLTLQIHL